jgi:phosphoserine aminotransferase
MKERNERKAKILYDYLDSQDYYIAPAKPEFRSMMNVTFVTGSADLDKKFASEAEKAGLVNLKGHRSVGGMRASIYNAMPEEGIVKLVEFMMKFAKSNKK